MADTAYYTLLTSLPHIDSLFNSKITPISRIQLDRRLTMLSTADQETLVKVEHLVHWSHLGDEIKEDYLINLSERLLQQLSSPDLIELVNWRLDMQNHCLPLCDARRTVFRHRRRQNGATVAVMLISAVIGIIQPLGCRHAFRGFL